jgi:hypothetical protein
VFDQLRKKYVHCHRNSLLARFRQIADKRDKLIIEEQQKDALPAAAAE